MAFACSENKRWETVRLAEIFTISAGGDIDRQNSSPTYSTSYPYPVYANALTNNGLYGYANYFKVEGDSITVTLFVFQFSGQFSQGMRRYALARELTVD